MFVGFTICRGLGEPEGTGVVMKVFTWDMNDTLVDCGVEVPAWIDQGITGSDICSIQQGGSASGAYMPAVIYHKAVATMSQHGDEVMEFIVDTLGELPSPPATSNWSQLATFYLSLAVDLWAAHFNTELNTEIEHDS